MSTGVGLTIFYAAFSLLVFFIIMIAVLTQICHVNCITAVIKKIYNKENINVYILPMLLVVNK